MKTSRRSFFRIGAAVAALFASSKAANAKPVEDGAFKLRAGCTYWTRAGVMTTPLQTERDGSFSAFVTEGWHTGGTTWDADGKCIGGSCTFHNDLSQFDVRLDHPSPRFVSVDINHSHSYVGQTNTDHTHSFPRINNPHVHSFSVDQHNHGGSGATPIVGANPILSNWNTFFGGTGIGDFPS